MGIAGAGRAKADAVSDFYAGKQMIVIVGAAVGGGYDAVARFEIRSRTVRLVVNGRYPGHQA